MLPLVPPTARVTDARSNESWDGADLSRHAAARATGLARLGVGPGGRVVIAHGGTPGFVADLLAVWRLGATAVCINPGLTAFERDNVTAFVRPQAVIDGTGGDSDASGNAPAAAGGLDDPALVLFTSGTTGDPKGVVLTFRALLARTALNRRHIVPGALRRTLCLLPTHFGHGLIGNLLTPLLAGGEVVLLCEPSMAEIGTVGRLIDDRRIGFLSSVPAFWRLALRAARPPQAGNLRQVHVGSAPLSADLWRAVGGWCGTDNVVNMYGITEAANWIAGASMAEHSPADGLVGTAWGGALAVDPGDSEPRAAGEGEVLVQSPSLMAGYLDRPDLGTGALDAGWYRTGDSGHLTADGVLTLTGRLKDEINRGGVKVQPAEVDLLLESHPDVAEACCFAVADTVGGDVVAAAVVPRDGAKLDDQSLRAWCAERLRRECLPERWFFPGALPRSERGKINRDAVRRHCTAPVVE